MAVRIQIRNDTAANWTSADPTLMEGEFGWESDTSTFKVGDGVTAWTALAYFAGGGGGGGTWGSIIGTLSAQTDLQTALNARQPLDSDLTTIAGLTATTDSFMQAKGSAWTARTIAQVKTDLDLTGTNSGDQTISLTGDVTGSGTGSFAATIANDAVTNAKAANMATASFKGRVTAGTGDPEDLTGTQATTLLDVATSALKGLVPASGGGTTNFLRADLTFAAPPGGGSGDVVGPASATDNALARFDSTTGKLVQNSGAILDDSGVLTVPVAAVPSVPSSGNLSYFARDIAGRPLPAVRHPVGLETMLQPHLGFRNISIWQAINKSSSATAIGASALTAVGAATAAVIAITNRYTRYKRLEYLVTTPSTTAVAGWRLNTGGQWTIGGASSDEGGFTFFCRWGAATGVTISTHRGFCGLQVLGTPTDVEPSTLVNAVGMGWDAADTNIQMMHNDGSGTCTKIDLGASFPVPTVDATDVYEIAMVALPGTTQEVKYLVTNVNTGATASGTITTNLPSTSTLLMPKAYMSVGGTSSVIGIAMMSISIEADDR